jgi:hypothetical protein
MQQWQRRQSAACLAPAGAVGAIEVSQGLELAALIGREEKEEWAGCERMEGCEQFEVNGWRRVAGKGVKGEEQAAIRSVEPASGLPCRDAGQAWMQAGNGRQRRGSLSGAHLLAEAEVLPATHYARHEAMLPTDLVALRAAAVTAGGQQAGEGGGPAVCLQR